MSRYIMVCNVMVFLSSAFLPRMETTALCLLPCVFTQVAAVPGTSSSEAESFLCLEEATPESLVGFDRLASRWVTDGGTYTNPQANSIVRLPAEGGGEREGERERRLSKEDTRHHTLILALITASNIPL